MADCLPYVTTIPVRVHLPARDAEDAEAMADSIRDWIEMRLAEREEARLALHEEVNAWPYYGPGHGDRFFVTAINVGECIETQEDDE